PQVIGAILAAAWLGAGARKIALRFIADAAMRPGVMPEGLEVVRLYQGRPGARPPIAGRSNGDGDTSAAEDWRGRPAEPRWGRGSAGRWRSSATTSNGGSAASCVSRIPTTGA